MRGLIVVSLLLFAAPVWAAVDVFEFDTPEQEARYKHLVEELRCTVCQNQNIAGSNAELAADLRRKTYELVQAGKSDEQILDYMVERYGNFVLYRPPLTPGTALLWVGPFLVFAFGGYLLFRVIRSRRSRHSESSVAADKVRQAEALLRDEGNKT